MPGWLDGVNLTALEKGLDASSLRQKVLANNVANVDTPNFKRSDVDFQAVLDSVLGANDQQTLSLKRTSEKQLPGVEEPAVPAVVEDDSTTLRNDGNNVDIDREMTNVAENSIYYNALTQSLTAQLGILRMVISEKP